jgi:hypothetical protein
MNSILSFIPFLYLLLKKIINVNATEKLLRKGAAFFAGSSL